MKRLFASMTLVILLLAGQALAGVENATVRVRTEGGLCSGVCVDPSGIIATAKHCSCEDFLQSITVEFKSGLRLDAEPIWVTDNDDGPLFLKVDHSEQLPAVKIAETVPKAGEHVYSIGTQRQNWETVARGPLKGGARNFMVSSGKPGEPFDVNVVDFTAEPGWSGGPVFNERDELIGLVLSTADDTCICSWSSLSKGFSTIPGRGPQEYKRSPETKPELMVFTSPYCSPCKAWKDQYYRNRRFRDLVDSKYHVTFHDANDSYAKQYGFTRVPAFVVDGRTIHQGYSNERAWLKGVGIGIGPVGIGAGVVVPPRPFLPDGHERGPPDDVPVDDIDRVDWNSVTLVIAVRTTVPLFTEKRAANVDRLEQRIRQATIDNGVPVNVRVMSRVLDQAAYDQFVIDTGIDESLVKRVHPVLLVPRLAGGGIKGFLAGKVSAAIGQAVEAASPLIVITERDEELRYQNSRATLYAYSPDMGEHQGERFGGFSAIEIVLMLVTALVVAKFNLLEMIVGFLQGIRSRVNLPRLEWDR